MACSRNQGGVLCFCAAQKEEGVDIPKAAEEEAMRIADCLEEDHEAEGGRRQKRRDLFLCLPPSGAASCDAYSPRSLISRLFLPLRWPSPARQHGGGGDVEEGVGCRMPFPKCGSGNRKGRERRPVRETLEKGEVDDGATMAEEPSAGEVSEVCAHRVERENACSAIVSGKKNDEVPLNLGMGVGLVFLLARSATEINRMVELREQMEILLKDIRDNVRKKDVSYNTAESSNPSSSVSNNSGNRRNVGNYNLFQESEDDASEQSMHAMEAELQAELERLQCAVEGGRDRPNPESVPENARPPESFSDGSSTSEEGYEYCGVSAHELRKRLNQLLEARRKEGAAELESSFDNNVDDDLDNGADGDCSEVGEEETGEEAGREESSGISCGAVSAPQLERRLHELLECRQREKIAELESALRNAEQKLREKEKEICRWRNTARLVSLHKKEALTR